MTESSQKATEWGRWLTDTLSDRALTVDQLVERSGGGFSSRQVAGWTKGRALPDARAAVTVADIVGVPMTLALRAAGFDLLADALDPPGDGAPGMGFTVPEAVTAQVMALNVSDDRKARMLARFRERAADVQFDIDLAVLLAEEGSD